MKLKFYSADLNFKFIGCYCQDMPNGLSLFNVFIRHVWLKLSKYVLYALGHPRRKYQIKLKQLELTFPELTRFYNLTLAS
jgi:hypothetical protein